MLLRRLETSLLQDTIERAEWHVHPEFSGHRDRTGLNRMLKLAVTTLRPNVVPPVLLDKSNCVPDLHVTVPLPSWHSDEVERRGVATTPNEADLSQSSTPSLARRRRDPRSLEPIVSFLCATPILRAQFRAPVSL
jgi:hypothetical protein